MPRAAVICVHSGTSTLQRGRTAPRVELLLRKFFCNPLCLHRLKATGSLLPMMRSHQNETASGVGPVASGEARPGQQTVGMINVLVCTGIII